VPPQQKAPGDQEHNDDHDAAGAGDDVKHFAGHLALSL
jgi:hypothetical protein